MKRLVLFVVALVFAFCTTVMAAEPMAAPTQEQAVAAEKATVVKDEAKVKADAKKAKAKVKAKKKVKKAAKKAAEKKADEAAEAAPAK
jgi:ABC-type transporter MlaC component